MPGESKKIVQKQIDRYEDKNRHDWRALPGALKSKTSLASLAEAESLKGYNVEMQPPSEKDKHKPEAEQLQHAKLTKGKDMVIDLYQYPAGGYAIEASIRPEQNVPQDKKDKLFIDAFEDFGKALHAAGGKKSPSFLLRNVQPERLHMDAIRSLLIDKATSKEERFTEVHYKGKKYWWDKELQRVESKGLEAKATAKATLSSSSIFENPEAQGAGEKLSGVDVDLGRHTSVDVKF